MTWPRLAIRMLEESVPKGCKTSRMMECEKLQLYLHILVLDGGREIGMGSWIGERSWKGEGEHRVIGTKHGGLPEVEKTMKLQ